MSAFHRQPSKVWWDSDPYANPYYRPPIYHAHRTQSSSPGSQDSGFSDTETSPQNINHKSSANIDIRVNNNNVTTIKVTQDNNRNLATVDVNDNNLLANVKEKYTPAKSNLRQLFEDRYKNGGPGAGAKSVSSLTTPPRRPMHSAICSEPVAPSQRYNKRNTTSKVNRNLFKSIQTLEDRHSNQYASSGATAEEHLTHTNNTYQASENTKDNYASSSITQIPEETQSLPNIQSSDFDLTTQEANLNSTAPAVLPELQKLTHQSGVDSSASVNATSDCDSEVEEIFPQHTSTPKQGPAIMKRDRLRRKLHTDKLLIKYKDERVPPIVTVNIDDYSDASLKAWYTDLNSDYEPECTTALQGKSIAAELADTVAKLAAEKTLRLREILNDAIVVYTEIDQLTNGESSSYAILSTCIRCYVSKHPSPSLHHHILDLSTLKSTPTPSYLHQLTADFTAVHNAALTTQVRRYLSEELAQPQTELDVRAAVVGMTSVCLHYAEGCDRRGVGLVAAFLDESAGAVEMLVSLCEMCEGSSVRRAILRALATVCATGAAVGRFEASGGVDKAIVDVVTDDALPEVERVEAIALLTQITAPWIDPPVTLPSIHPHLRPLIRSLTIFLHANTSCKQNLLLCTAALANLTTLYEDCVRSIVAFRTVDTLLKCLKRDKMNSSSIEVYILEQVAIVVANVAATDEGRSYLTSAPTTSSALVCFLQTKPYTHDVDNNHRPDDVAVVQRLQQKTIIALSRLCSNPKAAHHVVQMGGVKRLVMLCRDKGERYESDAVLVAALATLRKISETCGATIMTEQDSQELVEPRLLDSFLAYSAQNESLV